MEKINIFIHKAGEKMKNIPYEIENIIKTLEKNGFEGYIVGGCVRDILLGHTPNDFDITTSALPEEIKQIFQKTVDTGIKHGTVTVITENGKTILLAGCAHRGIVNIMEAFSEKYGSHIGSSTCTMLC